MNMGTLVVTLGADMTQLTAGLSKANSALQRFGFVASTALTAPMVMAGKASFQMAKDYEYAIQTIVGLTGTAQDVVNGLNQDILKMAPELARAPLELAQGAYFILSSGIKATGEAMEVLTVSAKAATAGLGTTQQMTQVLTSALNAYRGTGISAGYATDVIVAAVREGKAEASGFATSLGQIIPIAANLGVSFDQVAGGMAAITLTGASAANAAVYLKGVFNSLIKASSQGETALKKMGTSYADLRRILEREGLVALMQKLRDIQEEYGDEMLGDVIPNIRAMTGFMSFAGKNFQYNTELMKRVTESTGALADAFAAVANTIKVRYDTAISQAQVSLISLGTQVATTFIPILEKLVKALERLTRWFDSLSEAQRHNIIVVAMVVAALGPLALVVSSLVWILRGLLALLPSLTAGVTAFGLAFGAINIIALPALILLGKKIMEMKGKINEMKDALDFSDRGMELDTLIGKKMKVFSDLNVDELSQLKSEIAERIVLDRQRLLMAKAVNLEDIKQEAEYTSKMAEYKSIQEDWAFTKRQYARGLIVESDYKKFGSTVSLQLQKLENEMAKYETDRKAFYDYEKVAAQGNIDFYTKIENKVEAQIKNLQKVIDKVKELTAITKISEFPQFNIDMGLPEKFKKPSGWAKAIETDWTSSSNLYKGDWEEQARIIEQYNRNLETTRNIIDRLDKTFVALFTNIGGGFKGMIDAMLDSFKLLVAQLAAKAAIFGLLQLLMPGSTLAVHTLTNLRKFIGVPGFANGTNFAPGGLSIVGERGPELVNLPRGSQVIPNFNNLGFPQYEERLVAEVTGDQIAFMLQRKARKSNSFR